jgi:hypothetical protein
MKDLVDRYLAAVSRQLPEKQRADITAELRDLLLSQVEAKEEALGRLLTPEESEALLKDFGHPMAVAGRYRKVQHLIGPDIFPFWWAGFKATLTILAGVYLVLFILALASAGLADVPGIPNLSTALFNAFGVVTLVAVAIEQLGLTKHLYRWRPRGLPSAGIRLKSRFDAVVEAGMAIVFLFWWFGRLHFRDWLPYPHTVSIKLGPIFATLFWPIAIYSVMELLVSLLAIVGRPWVKTHAVASIARYTVGVFVLTLLLRANHWLDVAGHLATPGAMNGMEAGFNTGMRLGILGGIVTVLVLLTLDARRLWLVLQAEKAEAQS